MALALFLLLAPIAAVLQYRAIAPLALAAMVGVVLLWPAGRPRPGPVIWLALALMSWGALSAVWAVEPARSLFEGVRLTGLVLLAAAARHVLAVAPPRPLGAWLLAGLLLGASLMLLDQQAGHLVRATVRGLREWDVALGFGLKPAASVLALLLPLALGLAVAPGWRLAVLALVSAAVLLMPAQAAKIGLLAGVLGYAAARWLGPRAPRAVAVLAAAMLLLTPALLGALLARGPDISAMQGSASHRVLIWDFSLARIAERPWLGWGMEAARAIPGGRALIPAGDLARFGLSGQRDWFEGVRAQRLPLHTHNASLQIWLELGAVGAVLGSALVLVLGWRTTAPGAAGCFAAAIAIGSLSYGIWQGWWLCLLAMLALLAPRLSPAPLPR